MKTRRLGRTGLQVSELVFGGGFVGGLLITQDDDTKRQAIKQALAGGINFIDTAPSYGNGQSEQALGWLLKELDQQPYLSTKFNIENDSSDSIYHQIEASLHTSLERLQRDSVDLLQLHNRVETTASGRGITINSILDDNGVAASLERLRDQGLFKYIGFTALGDPACCKQVIASGRFDTAQIYYNLLNPSAGQTMPDTWSSFDFANLIATCKQHDVGVMNIRVFAAGVIATDIRHGREVQITPDTDVSSEEQKASAVLDILGEQYGTRAQAAIRFALAHDDISCVIFGLAELDHLHQALGAAELGPLPAAALAQLQTLYNNNFKT